jgi:hypothetical protein
VLKFVNEEWFRGVLYALVGLGILALLFATWQYINAAQQLQANIAQQIHENESEISPQTTTEARGLVAADMERRTLINQQFQAMMIGGAGLILIALGWIIMNFTGKRQRSIPTDERANL